MRVSEEKLNQNIKEQIFEILYQAIADLGNAQEVKTFFNDFLSETEQLALAKRLAIVLYLDKDRSYENIKDNLKVSSATIANTYKDIAKPGYQLALQKVKAEQWAENWSRKINNLIKRLSGRS